VLKADDEPVALDVAFTDRLMACMDAPRLRWPAPMRWMTYVGAPLAAAAVVAMAFLGFFDGGGSGHVAGVTTSIESVLGEPPVPPVLIEAPSDRVEFKRTHPLDEWFSEVQSDTAAKRRDGQEIQDTLDLTILQLLDILEDAKKDGASGRSPGPGLVPDGDPLPEPQQSAFEDGAGS